MSVNSAPNLGIGDGMLRTTVGLKAIPGSATLQDDGKIIVSGFTNFYENGVFVLRYNADGTLNTTFDGDGKLVSNAYSIGSVVMVQSDGKILAAGGDLVRFNPDGALDSSFGVSGKVVSTVQ